MITFDALYELLNRQKYDLALEKINQALEVDVHNSELKRLRAFAFYGKDENEEAYHIIKEAISSDPEYSFLFYTKAQIEVGLGRYEQAIKSLDEAIRIDPEEEVFYSLKAGAFLDLKKWANAKEFAEKALELNPDSIDARNRLASAEHYLGRTNEARVQLEHTLEKDPENEHTHTNLGFQFLQNGDVKKAKEHFGKSLELNPTNEFTKHGMIEAIKASNFVYRKLIQFYFWNEKVGPKYSWGLIIGLIIVINILPFLIPFYLLLLAWTWVTPPLADMIIYFNKYSKYLLDEDGRLITGVNLALFAASILSVLLTIVSDYSLLFLAFSLFFAIIPIYHIQTNEKKVSKIVVGAFGVFFIGCGVFGTLETQLYGNPENIFGPPLVLGIIVFTWVNSFLK